MFTNNGSSSTTQMDIFEKFCDPTSFAQMVSRLMVTEIRRRASNKTTENASMAIVEFLEISQTVNTSSDKKGWILLSTLNILVSFNSSHLISVMTSNSLASTLVKCLYLFFDLPPCCDAPTEEESSNDYLTNNERRQLLQKVFSQLLTRLCASPSALGDLTRKDDLSLLFNAITSWCPEHNSIWRKTASDVMITMAKHNNINVEYLHSKNCVNLFVENIQRIVELGSTSNKDIILMFQTFVHFLSEYVNNIQNNLVNILLDDFASSFGYQFFVDFAIRLEQLNEPELLIELLSLTHQFTKVGVSALKPRPLSVNQVFTIDNFTIPKPSTKNTIRNLKAFNILLSLWSRVKTDFLQDLVLETILNIYKEEKANYFILEGQNTLSSFAERLEEKSGVIQMKYYTLLEYVIFEMNYVPCKELITVGIILKNRHSSQSIMLCLKSLVRILKYNTIFRDVYREVGLLDIVCSIYCCTIGDYIEQTAQEPNEADQLVLSDLLELLINVLSGPNVSNCAIFHECAASNYTFSLITQTCANLQAKSLRKRAFTLVRTAIFSLSSCGEENLSQLLALLHRDSYSSSSPQETFSLKLSVLKSLLMVLSENHRIRAIFRKIGGFVSVISVIVHMENCLSGQPYQIDCKRVWNMLRFAIFTCCLQTEHSFCFLADVSLQP